MEPPPTLRETKTFDFVSTDDWGPSFDWGAEEHVTDAAAGLNDVEPAKGGAGNALENEDAANDEPPPALEVNTDAEPEEAGKGPTVDDRDDSTEANGLATVEKNTEGATMPPELPKAKEPE